MYNCNWVQIFAHSSDNFDYQCVQVKNNIVLIVKMCMMRAQKPIKITGGLFSVLSLETFKSVSLFNRFYFNIFLINLTKFYLQLVGFALSNSLILRQLSEET